MLSGTMQILWMWHRVSQGTIKAVFSRTWFLIAFFFSLRKGHSFGFVKLSWLLSPPRVILRIALVTACSFTLFQFHGPSLQTLFLGWLMPATASQGSVGFVMQLPLPGRTKLSEEKLTFWLTKPVFLLPQSVLRHQCNLLCKVGQCSEEQFLQLKKHGLS